MPDKTLDAVLAALAALPDQLRQAIGDHLWSTIPVDVKETAYNPNQAANTPLQLTPAMHVGVRITAVIASIPANATGTIRLGDVVVPIGQGLTVLAPMRLPLAPTDIRSVSSTIAGPVSLLVMGEQTPATSVLAR